MTIKESISEHKISFSGMYGLKLNEDSGLSNSSDGIGVDSLCLISLSYLGLLCNKKTIELTVNIDENNINSYSSILQLNEDSNLIIKTVPNISVGTIGLPNMFKSLFMTNGAGVTSDSSSNLISIMYNRNYINGLSIKSVINNLKNSKSAHSINNNNNDNNNQLINSIKNISNYIGGQLELQYNSNRLGLSVIGLKLGQESTNLSKFGDSKSNGIYMSYNYRPLHLGFESTEFNLDRTNDINQTAFSLGFELNDSLSLSYQSMKIDNNTVDSPTEDLKAFNIVYKISNMVVNVNYSTIENDNFTKNDDSSHMDLSILFDF